MTIFGTHYNGDAVPIYRDDEDRDEVPTGWYVVARDPRGTTYFDDEDRAIDVTNWDYLRGGFDPDDELAGPIRRGYGTDGTADYDATVAAFLARLEDPATTERWAEVRADEVLEWGQLWDSRRPPCITGSDIVLIVREDRDDEDTSGHFTAWEHYEQCASDLENYPLLDEDAYTALDHEAWERCWSDYVRRDIMRDAAATIATADDGTYDDDRYDEVYDALDDELEISEHRYPARGWADIAHEGMNGYYGLTGEYDHDGAVAAVVEWWHELERWELMSRPVYRDQIAWSFTDEDRGQDEDRDEVRS